MNRTVSHSQILIVAALLAACAGQRDSTESSQVAATTVDPETSGSSIADAAAPAEAPAETLPPSVREVDQSQRRDETLVTVETRASKVVAEELNSPVAVTSAVAPSYPAASYALPAAPAQNAACCVWQQPANTERYQHQQENPVQVAAEHPLSTFSIDVDTGAYANVRRFLNAGQLPPQDAVRVEEMINYFDYSYAQPASRDTPFKVTTELAAAPWNPQALLMKIGIKGYEVPASQRPPANLVFLIDVSGSMQTPDKLPLLKNAFRLLTDQLGAKDRVSMVVYAGSSGVVLEPTPGDQKHKIREAIDRLEAGGSTNGAEGIERAYQLAQAAHMDGGINRVVLATDGDFNVGVVNFEALVDMAERQRASGTALTTLGFGTGNYNDELLERLADAGNGNYAYVDTLSEARKVLVSELSSTLVTIASDVKIQVEFNPAEVLEYRLIGYENRLLAREDFNNDKVDAGEIGAGHRVTALYEVIPVGARAHVDPLRYGTSKPAGEKNGELAHLRLRYKQPNASRSQLLEYPVPKSSVVAPAQLSADFRFAASVAAFGQLLRGGKYLGEFDYDDVESLARAGLDQDKDGYRREFLSLVALAESLTPQSSGTVGQVSR